ncbi:unnamed protein product [Ilex paraguariensis]|uniref:Uncharacterized protein n=1 Tax=Ilex paraguariensis TaxID=185542 RepID=A0ABC8QUZ9_9AQUA
MGGSMVEAATNEKRGKTLDDGGITSMDDDVSRGSKGAQVCGCTGTIGHNARRWWKGSLRESMEDALGALKRHQHNEQVGLCQGLLGRRHPWCSGLGNALEQQSRQSQDALATQRMACAGFAAGDEMLIDGTGAGWSIRKA